MLELRRIVFFGTPAFAVPALEALVESGRSPRLVVSQPARPAGRGHRLLEPPVAVRARELGLAVEQPARVRDPGFLDMLRAQQPDLAVVVAFGQIFPRELLELPRAGCINLHASLLPRWRGAAPIQAAIASGDRETGVSIQQMEVGLDSGPVFAERRTPIGETENAGELAERLARLGAELLAEVIPAIEAGLLRPAIQDEGSVTLAPKRVGVAVLDPERPAIELARLVRASQPEPGAALAIRGERVRVLRATPLAVAADSGAAPGEVVAVEPEGLVVATGAGSALRLERVQRPGGRPVGGRDLANGLRLRVGDRLAG